MRIQICDFGVGNIASIKWALRRLGITPTEKGGSSQARILPGVGSFRGALAAVNGLDKGGIPTLGICLGMQLFFESSEEAPGVPGLGWLKGETKRLPSKIIPHKGQNDGYWFDHSFVVTPKNPEHVLAAFEYEGEVYPAVVGDGNLLGCQFHPEKSRDKGLEFLERWISSWA